MSHRRPTHACAAIFLTSLTLLAACGCVGAWRPATEHLSIEPPPEPSTLADSLRASRCGRWIYERQELPEQPGRPVGAYVRRGLPERMTEGILVWRPLRSIAAILAQPATQPTAADRTGTAGWGGGRRYAPHIYVVLDEALAPIPTDLQWGEPSEATTGVTYYDALGRPQASGTLRRVARLEGIEDITCPAGMFRGCLRVRVDLTVEMPWVLLFNLTGYMWLSPEAGEVRRVQRMSGWFLVFWFGSAHEYRLAEYRPAREVSACGDPCPRWKRIGVLFDRVAPRPQIGGLVVDYEDAPAGP